MPPSGPRAAARRPRAVEPRAQGHRARDRRLPRSSTSTSRSSRASTTRRRAALRARRHRRRPAQRRLVRAVRDRGDGARQAGRHVSPRGRRRADGGGLRRRGAARPRDEGDARRARCGRSSSRRRSGARIGAESRAYVERVHDGDRNAERLIEIYDAVATTSRRSTRSTASDRDAADLRPDHEARQAVGDLRPRRPRLPDPRRPPAAALHELPVHGRLREDRDARRRVGRARRSSSSSGSRAPSSASTSTRRTSAADPRRPDELLVHDDERDPRPRSSRSSLAGQISSLLQLGDEPGLVSAAARRRLGADELRAADLALPRRGARRRRS